MYCKSQKGPINLAIIDWLLYIIFLIKFFLKYTLKLQSKKQYFLKKVFGLYAKSA